MLADEKELLGFYVSGHPLDAYKPVFAKGMYRALGNIAALECMQRGSPDRRRKPYAFAGLVTEAVTKYSKRTKKPFMSVVLQDLTGQSELMLSGKTYETLSPIFKKGEVVALKGVVESSGAGEDDRRQIIVEDARPLPKPVPKVDVPGSYTLVLDTARTRPRELDRILETVNRFPGFTPLHLLFQRPDGREIRMATRCRVDLDPAFEQAVKEWRP